MLSIDEMESKLQEIKPVLTEKFHVSSIGYFGSYSNRQQTNISDLDLIVEFSQPAGWFFFMLESFLEEFLGLRVDLITNALKEHVRESILNQIKYI